MPKSLYEFTTTRKTLEELSSTEYQEKCNKFHEENRVLLGVLVGLHQIASIKFGETKALTALFGLCIEIGMEYQRYLSEVQGLEELMTKE